MILSASLKKGICLSLLGHITVFGIFSFSFGNRVPKLDYTAVSFWGQILSSSDLINKSKNFNLPGIKKVFVNSSYALSLDKLNRGIDFGSGFLKPNVTLTFNEDKMGFIQKPASVLAYPARKESVIIFHPLLPYHFTLYFKDRQTVHIELMFKIVSSGSINSVVIKRKISSGNLEADLLAMRYIGHYLFIQQARFFPNNWQIVKIDLSAGER